MLSKKTVIILFIILNAVIFTGTYLQMRKFGTVPETLSTAVPNFNWQDFNGKSHNIKDLFGHTVIIHFWATWCGPCRREFPALLAAAKLLDKDIIFLTISGDDRLESAQKFAVQAQVISGTGNLDNVLYAFDPDKKIAFDIFQTAVYPESIVIDKSGNMRRKFPGAVHWSNDEVISELKAF